MGFCPPAHSGPVGRAAAAVCTRAGVSRTSSNSSTLSSTPMPPVAVPLTSQAMKACSTDGSSPVGADLNSRRQCWPSGEPAFSGKAGRSRSPALYSGRESSQPVSGNATPSQSVRRLGGLPVRVSALPQRQRCQAQARLEETSSHAVPPRKLGLQQQRCASRAREHVTLACSRLGHAACVPVCLFS